ncbi:MAG: T9SS type A sorting domain-containing protein [Bacteroidia bacterium]
MKAKLYILSLMAGLGFAVAAQAQQCTATINSISVSGANVTVVGSGTGALGFPVLGWDWGDASSPSVGANATHTYASNGTYQICLTYFDALDTANCFATTCTSMTINAVGVSQLAAFEAKMGVSPNPFGNTTNFNLSLNQSSKVEMIVYDMTGKQVAMVYDGELNAGLHNIAWTPENLADGIYFIQVKAGDKMITRKIVHTTNN